MNNMHILKTKYDKNGDCYAMTWQYKTIINKETRRLVTISEKTYSLWKLVRESNTSRWNKLECGLSKDDADNKLKNICKK